jgi:hypothetical protein
MAGILVGGIWMHVSLLVEFYGRKVGEEIGGALVDWNRTVSQLIGFLMQNLKPA